MYMHNEGLSTQSVTNLESDKCSMIQSKMLNSVQSDECTTSDTGKCTRQKEFHVDKSTVTPNVFTKVFLMSIRQLRVRWYVEMMRQEMWVVSTNA